MRIHHERIEQLESAFPRWQESIFPVWLASLRVSRLEMLSLLVVASISLGLRHSLRAPDAKGGIVTDAVGTADTDVGGASSAHPPWSLHSRLTVEGGVKEWAFPTAPSGRTCVRRRASTPP